MSYDSKSIEEALRNYSALNAAAESGNQDMLITKVEIDLALRKLRGYSVNLYNAIISVFVLGTPIQEHAKESKITKRQVHRRLDDGLHMLVLIMNGEFL
jgi:DNA-directed RNA polymerase specialized sigma24 family protein